MSRVLIVDDASIMRNLLKSMLKADGYEICAEAADADTALELYKKEKPDVVFCDLLMPGKDGFVLLKEIIEFDGDAKVIVCSSQRQDHIVENALAQGAKAYLKKPFSKAEVLKITREVLQPIVKIRYKDRFEERAQAKGLTQREILDFYAAFRTISEVDMGSDIVTKEFLATRTESIVIGLSAFLAAKISLTSVDAMIEIFEHLLED